MTPTPDSFQVLKTVPAVLKEFLDYCALGAIQSGEAGSIAYDCDKDIVTYHYTLQDLDRDLFSHAKEVLEVWVMQRGVTQGVS
jgi:hypothetical protein